MATLILIIQLIAGIPVPGCLTKFIRTTWNEQITSFGGRDNRNFPPERCRTVLITVMKQKDHLLNLAEILEEFVGSKPCTLSLPKPCLYIGKNGGQPISLAYNFPKSSACLHPSLDLGPTSRQAAHLCARLLFFKLILLIFLKTWKITKRSIISWIHFCACNAVCLFTGQGWF